MPNLEPEGALEYFTVHNVFTAFLERKCRASTTQSVVAIETTIKALGHVNMSLNIATNVSFEDENEGNAVDSEANDNGTANAVEATHFGQNPHLVFVKIAQ
ncbi:hypothetical protein MAM1_0222c08294 [Mucor ambiguus]|uniref:Uncharacterized protein n=1 Tax=Mucor ambiguus TaxID=91626 RepID=A0A0C9N2I3_9FUNG|nr:hypothetical protein MAM1_0222c08294 [Mucor ambiguus]